MYDYYYIWWPDESDACPGKVYPGSEENLRGRYRGVKRTDQTSGRAWIWEKLSGRDNGRIFCARRNHWYFSVDRGNAVSNRTLGRWGGFHPFVWSGEPAFHWKSWGNLYLSGVWTCPDGRRTEKWCRKDSERGRKNCREVPQRDENRGGLPHKVHGRPDCGRDDGVRHYRRTGRLSVLFLRGEGIFIRLSEKRRFHRISGWDSAHDRAWTVHGNRVFREHETASGKRIYSSGTDAWTFSLQRNTCQNKSEKMCGNGCTGYEV